MTTHESHAPTEEAPSLAATGETPSAGNAGSASARPQSEARPAASREARTIHAARDLIRLAGGASAAKQVIDDLGS